MREVFLKKFMKKNNKKEYFKTHLLNIVYLPQNIIIRGESYRNILTGSNQVISCYASHPISKFKLNLKGSDCIDMVVELREQYCTEFFYVWHPPALNNFDTVKTFYSF